MLLPLGACACVSPRHHPAPARSPLSWMHKWGLPLALVDRSRAPAEQLRLAPRLRPPSVHRGSTLANMAPCVEQIHAKSDVITGTLMIEKPAGSKFSTIAEEETGKTMPKRSIVFAVGALLLAAVTAMWATQARRNPAACPYGQRLFLDLPRPFMRRQTLRDMLDLAPGERVLEVGPGTGYYSLDVARQLAPDGQLDVLDLQQPMLDELMRRAAMVGTANVVATQGDARDLPFPAATFNAAFLVATLGEIPNRDRALRELHRVLMLGGRLVVGEGQPDPHMLTMDDLRGRAEAIGFIFDGHRGTPLGYFARFRTG